jgi:alpha-glucosidase
VASALPYGTNIYEFEEVIASNGFRRDIGVGGSVGCIQTNWNRDIKDPIDENRFAFASCLFFYQQLIPGFRYGSHPIYIAHRFDGHANKPSSSGVLLLRCETTFLPHG